MLMGSPKFPSFTTPSMPTKGDIQRGLEKGKQLLFSKKGKLLGGLLSVMLLDRSITHSRWFEKEKQSLWDDDIQNFEKWLRCRYFTMFNWFDNKYWDDKSSLKMWKKHVRNLKKESSQRFDNDSVVNWGKIILKDNSLLFNTLENVRIKKDSSNNDGLTYRIVIPDGYQDKKIEVIFVANILDKSFLSNILKAANNHYGWALNHVIYHIVDLQELLINFNVLKLIDKYKAEESIYLAFVFLGNKNLEGVKPEAYEKVFLLHNPDPADPSSKEYQGGNYLGKVLTIIVDDIRKHKKGDQSKTNLVSIYKDTYINRRAFINRVYWRIVKKVIGNKPQEVDEPRH